MLELRRPDAVLTPRIAVLMTLPPLMWAGNAVVGRLMVGSVPPLALNAMRWALALALLAPLGWRVLRAPRVIGARIAHLGLLGLLGVGSYNALQYLAVHTSSPINVTLIASSSPVFMMAIGALFFDAPPGRAQLAGGVLSIGGVLLVVSRGSLETLLAVRLVAGDLYMLLATALWGFYSWMLARPPASMRGAERPAWDWAEFLFVQMLFGTLWAALMAAAEGVVAPQPFTWDGRVLAALLFVAVGPSLIAYRCWGLGVAKAGPAVAAFFSNLTPLFAALLSALLIGEPPRPYHGLAFALIIAGIVVSSGVLAARARPD